MKPHNRRSSAISRIVVGLAVTATALSLAACGSDSKAGQKTPGTSTATSAAPTSAASPTTTPAPAGKPVHVSLLFGDGAVVGVGMPIIAYFTQKISDPTAFMKATKITVNGQANNGHWYFEKSAKDGSPLEAHYRPAQDPNSSDPYWPAHASIYMDMKTQGLSGGTADDGGQYTFDNSLTLEFQTGAKHVTTVDCSAEQLVATEDGQPKFSFPVSCGAAKTPTFSGIKVVMQKGEDDPKTGKLRPSGEVRMSDTRHTYDEIVGWSVRITGSGEYIHAASWNGRNIGRVSTSNGCTNLNPGPAQQYYQWAVVGDVALYSNTGGTVLPEWDGYGDWNVSTTRWNGGGLLSTTG